MSVAIADLAKRPGRPLSTLQLVRLRKWLDEDWEAADMDRDLVNVVRRLMLNLHLKSTRRGR